MRTPTSKLLLHTRAYYTSVDSPTPRNLTQEGLQQLAAAQQTAPGYYALNQQYQPLYGQQSLNNAAQQQNGYTDSAGTYHPGTVALGQQANYSNRGAAVNDLNYFGGATTAGLLGSNPFLADALGLQSNAANAAGGYSPLLATLNQQAGTQLAANGALSPQEARDLSQAAQSGFAARGAANTQGSLVADLFSRDAATRARQQQAQTFAGSVQGLNQNQQQLAGNLAGSYANSASQSLTNPLLQLLGLGNLNPGYSGGTGSSGSSAISSSNDLFPQNSSYASDLFNTNYNAQASSNIANAQAQNGTTNALIGLFGSLLASDKRLKRKIKVVGQSPSGIPEVEFEYKTGEKHPRRFHGYLAQDVERVSPAAVVTMPGGIKAVRSDMVDAPFYELPSKGRSLGQLLTAA